MAKCDLADLRVAAREPKKVVIFGDAERALVEDGARGFPIETSGVFGSGLVGGSVDIVLGLLRHTLGEDQLV